MVDFVNKTAGTPRAGDCIKSSFAADCRGHDFTAALIATGGGCFVVAIICVVAACRVWLERRLDRGQAEEAGAPITATAETVNEVKAEIQGPFISVRVEMPMEQEDGEVVIAFPDTLGQETVESFMNSPDSAGQSEDACDTIVYLKYHNATHQTHLLEKEHKSKCFI
eukprot:TRINITY_DN3045_c0_g1_i1.p1 TRINITY_DN3045_c0_g1~~TRINITY_DN3045_c0_g1_i1.p1  ORF type:complete len:167 (+),score=18.54 TRINITY_DN3045_c0_g1_i1:217-717(+)